MAAPYAVADAQRDDPSLDNAALVAVYEASIDDLRNAVAGMTVEQFRARPIPGKWSTLEVLCHLADCDQMFADRMKRVLGMNRPLLIGVDPTNFSESLHYQSLEPAEQLALITITRRQMAHVLRQVSEQDWQRCGVHSETGLITLRQILSHAINHQRHHLQFVAEKRAAL
jgi:uncharacterized damage-inducible protein DinB